MPRFVSLLALALGAPAPHAADWPQCGVFLYPESWLQTWGLAVLLVAGTVGFVFAAAWPMR